MSWRARRGMAWIVVVGLSACGDDDENRIPFQQGLTYGNWCGAGTDVDNAQPPIDPLDTCCREHDFCYGDSVEGIDYADCRAAEKVTCDALLITCLDDLPSDPNTWTPPAKDRERAQSYRDDARKTAKACVDLSQ